MSVTYDDFTELRNAFEHQQFTGKYNLKEMPQKIIGKTFNILKLRDHVEQQCSIDVFSHKFDEDTIGKAQKTNSAPIFGGLYTARTTKFVSRQHEASCPNTTDCELPEFKLAHHFASACTNFMVLTKYKSFCDLVSFVNMTTPQDSAVSSLVVGHGFTGFSKYLESISRFYPQGWITFYIDYFFASKYLGNDLAPLVTRQVETLFNQVKYRETKKYAGSALLNHYILNRQKFTDVCWDVNILCPGVVVGYTPGMMMYGQALQSIMSMKGE